MTYEIITAEPTRHHRIRHSRAIVTVKNGASMATFRKRPGPGGTVGGLHHTVLGSSRLINPADNPLENREILFRSWGPYMVAPCLPSIQSTMPRKVDCSHTSGLLMRRVSLSLMEYAKRRLITSSHSRCYGPRRFRRLWSDLIAITS